MKQLLGLMVVGLLAGCAFPQSKNPASPFELSFRREPGMMNYGMLSPDCPGYDEALPGYHVLGELNGVVQMILRPTSEAPPPTLVLSLQGGSREVDPSTGETVVKPCSDVRLRAELWDFSVRQGHTVIRNRLVRRYNKLIIRGGPTDYFRYEIVADTVHVTFLPKAMELLNRECRIVWSHSRDR